MSYLKIRNLTKKYGKQTVINNLSLSLPKNTIYGLIGKNGAGKTTTIKLILGIIEKDGGEITIDGQEVVFADTKTNKNIGYLPDVPSFYNYLSSKEYLKLCGNLLGIPKNQLYSRIDYLLNTVDLKNNSKRIGTFSRGMKQRLGLAQSLINSPQLLICDEPTSALDPIGRREILDILIGLRKNTTILLSSHSLSDVEAICDRIGIINNGQMALEGEITELKNKHNDSVTCVEFENDDDVIKGSSLIFEHKFVHSVDHEKKLITIHGGDAIGKIVLSILINNNIHPISFARKSNSLENLFLEVVS